MSKYILKSKQVGEFVVEWEKSYDKGEQKESLPMFIVKKQTIFLLEILIEKGFNLEDAKTELKKLVNESK
jgi:hypothetical protein